MKDEELKIQALLEKISQDALRHSNEIADLRVGLTKALARVAELEKYVAEPKQTFTADSVEAD